MKTTVALAIFLLAATSENLAGEVDTNRLSIRRSVTVVYRVSREQVESAAKRLATNLWRVEVKPGTSQAILQEWKSEASDIPSENETRSRLNYCEFKFFWMPPEVAPRPVSQGGRIVPVRSPIWITVGSLKTNNSLAFITLSRDLRQKTTLHLPYTEIPVGRGDSSATGIYRTDLEWLKNLLGTNAVVAEFVGEKFFSPEVMRVLETGTKDK